ncbi:hypothetical protein E2562_015059 [Oryza meyeriana var. granulata]|uniref:Uncharacterized protein n=1 Tax=Oryza meyeriana var. granulata TaxID=110450 RepID=A0A6G1EK65_9ORYZ|nr:hypothetical protein E2562_015059 [Oryza meyeriana var. granulata]
MGIGDNQAQMWFPRPPLFASSSSPDVKIDWRGRGLQIATSSACRRRWLRVGRTCAENLLAVVHHSVDRLAHGEAANDPAWKPATHQARGAPTGFIGMRPQRPALHSAFSSPEGC